MSSKTTDFHFSISDLGIFLGKSPVTIRAWERKGLMTLPRVGANRSLRTTDVRAVARTAHVAGRITMERHEVINEALAVLEDLEQETK